MIKCEAIKSYNDDMKPDFCSSESYHMAKSMSTHQIRYFCSDCFKYFNAFPSWIKIADLVYDDIL